MNNMENTDKVCVGIDISKLKFDLALLRSGKFKHKAFKNDKSGFKLLLTWLDKQQVTKAHVCMESTNIYGDAVAEILFDNKFIVSIVNPTRIKGFAQSELNRTKTDKSDAALIARFCLAMNPASWTPDPLEIRQLRALVRRVESLIGMRQQEVNRRHVAQDILLETLEEHIEFLDQAIVETKKKINEHIENHPDLKNKKQLLETIPGIGEATINMVLSEFANIEKFKNAKSLAAFIGVVPKEKRSGTSVRGRSSLSKMGNPYMRKKLFLPAMVALRFNPILIDLNKRLTKAGKSKMSIIGAAMRKLVHLIYGVLKSGMPFDENYAKRA